MVKLTRLALCLLVCVALGFTVACKKDEYGEETPATTEYGTTTEPATTDMGTTSTDMGTDMSTDMTTDATATPAPQ
jgi:hypothetical protein